MGPTTQITFRCARRLAVVSLFLVAFSSSLRAEEPQVTVKLAKKGKAFVYAFFVDELIEVKDGLPLVKVTFGGVFFNKGRFVKKVRLNRGERGAYRDLLKKRPGFRLFMTPSQIGIFRYVEAAPGRTDRSGIILEALPHDKDTALRDMTEDVRERNRLENVLDMTVDEAADVMEQEDKIAAAVARWVELELALLKNPDAADDFRPFFVQTARPK